MPAAAVNHFPGVQGFSFVQMKGSPAFQFYPGDYLRSQRVQLLSLEEEGAYIRLLSYCWLHGSIPADPVSLCRLIGKGASTTLATTLATMFKPGRTDGTLTHDRLESEREKQDAWRAKSSAGGLKSAELRASKSAPINGHSKGASTTLPTKRQHSCLQSSDSINLASAPPQRARDLIFEALSAIDGADLEDITKSARGRINKAKSEIKAVCPELSSELIMARASRYKRLHPDWPLTSSALASHWAELGDPVAPQRPESPEPAGWRMFVARAYPDWVNGPGKPEEFKTWKEIPLEYQAKFAREIVQRAAG